MEGRLIIIIWLHTVWFAVLFPVQKPVPGSSLLYFTVVVNQIIILWRCCRKQFFFTAVVNKNDDDDYYRPYHRLLVFRLFVWFTCLPSGPGAFYLFRRASLHFVVYFLRVFGISSFQSLVTVSCVQFTVRLPKNKIIQRTFTTFHKSSEFTIIALRSSKFCS
jgi:hypothetical protein